MKFMDSVKKSILIHKKVSLTSPYIVTLLDVCETGSNFYMITDFCPMTLEDYRKKFINEQVPEWEA